MLVFNLCSSGLRTYDHLLKIRQCLSDLWLPTTGFVVFMVRSCNEPAVHLLLLGGKLRCYPDFVELLPLLDLGHLERDIYGKSD